MSASGCNELVDPESCIVNLRMHREADTDGLIAVFTSSVHALAAARYDAAERDAWAPVPPDVDEWRRRLGELHTIVAEEDGSYLGFLSYEANGHIDLLYTAPGATRRGVASALLVEADSQLASDGGVAELFTEASLVAVPFFLRHRFEIVEEQNVIRRGVNLRRIAMRRRAVAARP